MKQRFVYVVNVELVCLVRRTRVRKASPARRRAIEQLVVRRNPTKCCSASFPLTASFASSIARPCLASTSAMIDTPYWLNLPSGSTSIEDPDEEVRLAPGPSFPPTSLPLSRRSSCSTRASSKIERLPSTPTTRQACPKVDWDSTRRRTRSCSLSL